MSEPNDTNNGQHASLKRRKKRDVSIDGNNGRKTESVGNSRLRPKQVTSTATKPVNHAPQKTKSSSHSSSSNPFLVILPSVLGLAVLFFIFLGRSNFRGRATVAGIDLGTTNSVVCVQSQAHTKGVGEINCIVDPETGSSIIPSVVSFVESSTTTSSKKRTKQQQYNNKNSIISNTEFGGLFDNVIVGSKAKRRIDTHPQYTIFNAKRIIGRTKDDVAVSILRNEVEFEIGHDDKDRAGILILRDKEQKSSVSSSDGQYYPIILPQLIGTFVVSYLMELTRNFLGHSNIKSAVICVPAKFSIEQKMATYEAFRSAGLSVARVVEEPTAAALAYGLHKKANVNYILVYDFGGGTLDCSILHVSEGYVEVMGSDGDNQLGGADFDAAVAHALLDDKNGRKVVDAVNEAVLALTKSLSNEQSLSQNTDLDATLVSECPRLNDTPLCTMSSLHTLGEELKIKISSLTSGSEAASVVCLGLDADTTKQSISSVSQFCNSLKEVSMEMTLDEFDQYVQPLFVRSVTPVVRLLDSLQLESDDIDEVVMVGGTTRMPQIRRLVQEVFPTAQLNTHIDPDITVAYGAASVID